MYQHEGSAQTALVLLNKGDAASTFAVSDYLQSGAWRDAFTGKRIDAGKRLRLEVPAHGARVLFFDRPLTRKDLRARLADSMARKDR